MMKINTKIRKKRLRSKFLKGALKIGNRRLSCKRIGEKISLRGFLFQSTALKHAKTLLAQHDIKIKQLNI